MARGKKLPGTPAGFGAQAVQVARSDQYGQGAAQERAQQAVPLPKMGPPPPSPGGGPSMTPGAVPLTAPSGRPNEPITEGASFGPGSTLADLSLPQPQPAVPPVDPKMFTAYLPQLEAIASMPDSNPATRSLVRRLRAALPPDFDPTEQM